MTRQFVDVDDDEENLQSRKKFSPPSSQKPKRRLFLDSSEGEDVEKEDKDKRKKNKKEKTNAFLKIHTRKRTANKETI